jgi:hypothetical protein
MVIDLELYNDEERPQNNPIIMILETRWHRQETGESDQAGSIELA